MYLFTAALGLLLRGFLFLLRRLLSLQSTWPRALWDSVAVTLGLCSCSSWALGTATVGVVHGPSCPLACGIFLDHRMEPMSSALRYFTTGATRGSCYQVLILDGREPLVFLIGPNRVPSHSDCWFLRCVNVTFFPQVLLLRLNFLSAA